MREHKFKGKRVDNGEWVYGWLVCSVSRAWIKDVGDKTSLRSVSSSFADWRCVEVIPETVGQFTGLRDKNGKEIYEGDIVVKSAFRKGTKFIIKFINGAFKLCDIRKYEDGKTFEQHFDQCHDDLIVIGNIHSNPELTEVQP